MSRYHFTLKYQQIECSRCTAVRIRGVVCPDCERSPDPWEIDPHVQRRIAVAKELSSLVLNREDAPEATVTVLDFEGDGGVFEQFSSWVHELLSGLKDAAESDFRDVEPLRSALLRFTDLAARVDGANVTRPHLYAHKKAREMSRAGSSLISEYLAALQALTPILAQEHAEKAQDCIRALQDADDDLQSWLERSDRLDSGNSTSELLSGLLQDAMAQSGSEDLLQLDRAFRDRIRERLHVDVEPGAAMPYATSASLAAVYLDDVRFHALVERSFELYTANGEAIRRLLRDPEFQDDLARIEFELFDGAAACHAVVSGTNLVRQATRAVCELHASLVESAGLIVATSMLLATGRRSAAYRNLRRTNATELLRTAQSEDQLRPLLLGLNDHIRNAHAHRAITYGDDGITTDLSSHKRHFALDELVDGTYEAIESLLANLVALRLAASALGATIEDGARLRELGMQPEDILCFMLNAFGHRCVSCAIEDRTLVAELDAPNPFGVSVAIGAMMPHLPADQSWELRLRIPQVGDYTCELQTYADFRRADDDFSQRLAVIRIQAAWRNEAGRRHLGTGQLRKWAAAQAAGSHDLEPRLYILRMRTLRQLALELGDDDLAEVLTGVIRLRRLEQAGESGGPSEAAALRRLLEWGHADIDFALI